MRVRAGVVQEERRCQPGERGPTPRMVQAARGAGRYESGPFKLAADAGLPGFEAGEGPVS